jgi:O-acetyl-ADP-ribose deacetylase (regulator of RNase III)
MIEIKHGNLLTDQVEVLVNTVNCFGAMGRGIARQFEAAFPAESKIYKEACRRKQVKTGKIFVVDVVPQIGRELPHYIFHFVTKDHWSKPSKIEWVKDGLIDLVQQARALNIRSISVPPLGCGHGGLAWEVVGPMIIEAFEDLPDIQVFLHPPEGAPLPEEMIHSGAAPKMTKASALYIQLLKNYCVVEPTFTHLELQKLAYFLQEAGETSLRLEFKKGEYGPYASDIRHVLGRAEGYWITGYGDGTGGVNRPMMLKQEAIEQSNKIILQQQDGSLLRRFVQVTDLVDGYDTSLGVELLATVHYVAKKDNAAEQDVQVAIQSVADWGPRKRKVFTENLVADAWSHLHSFGWLNMKTDQEILNFDQPVQGIMDVAYEDLNSSWELLNERRIDLIYKEVDGEITEQETVELERLQLLADNQIRQTSPLPFHEIQAIRKGLREKGIELEDE